MRKIYIVQSGYYDYECSGSDNMKAFLSKKKAEEYKEDLELRNMVLHDKFKEIEEERAKEKNRIATMNLTRKEYIAKWLEIGKVYTEKRNKFIEESGLGNDYIANMETAGFEIEELELDESE